MVTTTVAPVTQGSAAGAVVLRDGQSVVLAPQEVLQVGDRVVTTGKAADVLVPTASGAKSVLLRVAPNSEIVVRPPQANGGPATADVVVTSGDAEFVGLPDDLGEPVSILKKTKSSSMLAGGDLGMSDGFVGGLLPFGAGLATLAALAGSDSSSGASGLVGAAGTSGTGTGGTGGTGATGATGGIGGTGTAIVDQGLLNSVAAVTAGLGVPLAAVVGTGGLLGDGGTVDQLLGGGLVGNPGLVAHLPAAGRSTTLSSGVDRIVGNLTTSTSGLPAPLNGLNLAPVAALEDQITTAVDVLALGPNLNNQGLLSQAATAVTGVASTVGTLTGNTALGNTVSNLAVNATTVVASVLATDVLNSRATSTATSLLGPNGMLDQTVATLTTNLDQTLVTGGTINHLLAAREDQVTNGVNQIAAPVTGVVDHLTAYLNGGLLSNANTFLATHGADQQLVTNLVNALDAQGFVGGLVAGVPVGVGTIVQGLDASHLVADVSALAQSLLSAGSGGAPAILQPVTTLVGGLTPGAFALLQPVTTLVNGAAPGGLAPLQPVIALVGGPTTAESTPLLPVAPLVHDLAGGADPLQAVTTLVNGLAPGATDPLQPVTTLVHGLTPGATDPLQPLTSLVSGLTSGTDPLQPVTALVNSLAPGATDPLQPVTTLVHGLTPGATDPLQSVIDTVHAQTAGPAAPVTALVDQAALLPVNTASLVSLAGTVPGASTAAPVVTQVAEALAPIQQPIVAQPAVHSLNDVVGNALGHRLI